MNIRDNVIDKIEKEFNSFKEEMLCKSKEEVFASSNIINFYSCIAEYVMYNENIDDKYISFLNDMPNTIGSLYQEYLKNEYLEYSRWSAIEDIFDYAIYRSCKRVSK